MKNRKSSVLFLCAAGLLCLLLWQAAASLSRNPLTAYGESFSVDCAAVAAPDNANQTENSAFRKAETLTRTILQEYLEELSALNRAEAQAKTEAIAFVLGEEYTSKQARCNAVTDEIRSMIETAESSDLFRAFSEELQREAGNDSASENWKTWSEITETFTSLQEKEIERFTLLREMKQIERDNCDKVKTAVMEVKSKFSPQKKALLAVFNAKMQLIEKAAGDCRRTPAPIPPLDPEFSVEPRIPEEIRNKNNYPAPGTHGCHPENPEKNCPCPDKSPNGNPSENPGENTTDMPGIPPVPSVPAPSANNMRTPPPTPPTGLERAFR